MSWQRTESDPDEEHDIDVQRQVDDAWFAQDELLRQRQETTEETHQ